MSAVDVVHVLWSGRIGGIERQVAAMVRQAARRGGGRHLAVLLDGAGPVGDALVAEGLAVRLGLRAGWDPAGLARLVRLLRRTRPRVLHMHTHALAAHAAAWAAVPGAVRVYTEHSPRALRADRKFRLLYRLLRAQDARLVALSPAMADAMAAQGAPAGGVAVVPNAVDVARAEPPGRGPGAVATVGVVARLAPQKRIDLLMEVVAELRARGTACRALVVGGGPSARALEARRAELGLEQAVELAGERDDVVPWLDRMDVVLMTSSSEPFGIAALEAMARQVPVVAMPCPGGLAQLAAEGGLLLADRSVPTAADVVGRLLASPGERAELRARGRAVVERHAPAAVLEALEAVYRAGPATPGAAALRPAPPPAG